MGNLTKKTTLTYVFSLAENKLHGLVINITSNAASNAINKFERRITRKGVVKTGKEFTLFVSNEDMNTVIRIIKSIEDSAVLIDGVTETTNQKKIKGTRWNFLVMY